MNKSNLSKFSQKGKNAKYAITKLLAVIKCLFYIEKKEIANLTNDNEKYLAVSFDDFRATDFSWVIPMLRKHGFHGTFNMILKERPSFIDKIALKTCIRCGMEVGDHTFFHVKFPYYSPLFNGQDPACREGLQIPFPTNDEMRCDRGDGKNVFGFLLDSSPSFQASELVIKKKWHTLSDEDCQRIRDHFSVYSNYIVGGAFDRLSNKYLGTSGKSKGSWDGAKYTGGIFTGCKTSENHEIWERILEIERLWYKDHFPALQSFTNWSMPGSEDANLLFDCDGYRYYDRKKEKPANDGSSFSSSLYCGKERSWTSVLQEYGYLTKSDSISLGIIDGQERILASHWFVNGNSSRKNYCLDFPVDHSVQFDFYRGYSKFDRFSLKDIRTSAKKMYDMRDEGEDDYYQTIEKIRRDTSQGIICGSIWDSGANKGEKVYWSSILHYCRRMGIRVVSNREAYQIMFNKGLTAETGKQNEIYNSNNVVNSIKEYIGLEKNCPPDGFEGDCSSVTENGRVILNISGLCSHCVYGMTDGRNYHYHATVNGKGRISISLCLLNNNPLKESEEVMDWSFQTKKWFDYNNDILSCGIDGVIGLKVKYDGEFLIMNEKLIEYGAESLTQ